MPHQIQNHLKELKNVPPVFDDVFSYWNQKKASNFAPKWSDFHMDQLPYVLLPWSVVVDVLTDPTDFYFRYWGTKRVSLIGKDMTGKRASDITNSYMREANIEEYIGICERKKPMLFETPIVKKNGLGSTVPSLRLPFSDDGLTVTHIFSAMDYDTISTVHYEIFGTESGINFSALT